MNIKIIELPPEPYIMYFLGDIHEGAANFKEAALRKAVDMIKEDGNGWLGLGDYIDAINHHDPRFSPKEINSKYPISALDDLPRIQSDNVLEYLEPIKDKCVGLIGGNHEDTYKKYHAFDVVHYMAENMNCDILGHKAWLSLQFRYNENKSIPFKIVAMHGAGGGGMREGYSTNKVYDLFRWDIADMHIMGHLHQCAVSRPLISKLEYGRVRKEPSWYCVSGCFLSKSEEGTENYFEQKAGMESSIGVIKLTILPHHDGKHAFKSNVEMIYL